MAVCSALATRSGVIPAKAGIHAAAFAPAHGSGVSTPKASAGWIPAFAGMTTEGVDAASSVCAAAALSVHANAADPVTRHQNSRAR